jgi:hypothetical protein
VTGTDPTIDPAKVAFCRDLKEAQIGDDYFHREILFEAIDRLVQKRIAEALVK